MFKTRFMMLFTQNNVYYESLSIFLKLRAGIILPLVWNSTFLIILNARGDIIQGEHIIDFRGEFNRTYVKYLT